MHTMYTAATGIGSADRLPLTVTRPSGNLVTVTVTVTVTAAAAAAAASSSGGPAQ